MYQLINRDTNEVVFTGETFNDCKIYAVRNGLVRVERIRNFIHVIWGYYDVEKVK